MYDRLAQENHGGLGALLALLAASTVAMDPKEPNLEDIEDMEGVDPDTVEDDDFGNFPKAACVEHWRREKEAGVPRSNIEESIETFLARSVPDEEEAAFFRDDTREALDRIYGVTA